MTRRALIIIATYEAWASRMDSGKATLEDLAYCANDFVRAILRQQPTKQGEAA